MHRAKFALSNCKGLAQASCCFVSLILLEIVDSHQEVGVACLEAVLIEELLNDLNVAYIRTLTLLFHVHGIVESAYESIRLEDPT